MEQFPISVKKGVNIVNLSNKLSFLFNQKVNRELCG